MIHMEIRDRKAMKITVVCLAVSLVVMVAILAARFIKYKEYITVKATVVDSFISVGTHDNLKSRHYKVRYAYDVDGKHYEASRVEEHRIIKNIGEVKTIRCDPKNPKILEDEWAYNGLVITICIGTFLLIIMILGLKQKRR